MKKNFFNFTLKSFKEHLVQDNLKPFLAKQVFRWVYRHFELDTSKWSNVSKTNIKYLNENFNFSLPKIAWQGLSKDGTRKFLVQFETGTVECVIIFSAKRKTLCVSSQIGCAVGCTFCHTGTMGFKRNLEVAEIVGQFVSLALWMRTNVEDESEFSFSNIVFMGQGEPLLNMENVKHSIELFMLPEGLGLGQRRITVSTSGLAPQVKKLMDFPPVNIAISLHASHDDIRSELMPINQVYDLKRLFAAIETIPLKAYRRITYEYILIANLNDRLEDIEGLQSLLKSKESKINIIPFNEYPESNFKKPSADKIKWFSNELNERGYVCTVRATKGDDILAACGQLKSLKET